MSTESVVLLVLLILAFVLIALRGCGVGHPRFDFGWIGVALLVLVYIIQTVIV
jgi:hypothetical protein